MYVQGGTDAIAQLEGNRPVTTEGRANGVCRGQGALFERPLVDNWVCLGGDGLPAVQPSDSAYNLIIFRVRMFMIIYNST